MKKLIFIFSLVVSVGAIAQEQVSTSIPTIPKPIDIKQSDEDPKSVSAAASGAVQMENDGFRKSGTSLLPLRIYHGSSTNPAQRFYENGFIELRNTDGQLFGWGINASGQIEFISNGTTTFGTSSTAMTIDDDTKNIGIGTITPDKKLHVFSGTSGITPLSTSSLMIEDNVSHYIQMASPEASETGVLFGKPSNSASGGIVYDASNNLKLRTGGNVDRLTINSAGNVGVGLTNPSQKLNIRDGNILLETGTVDKVYIQASGANSAGEITINASNGNQSIEIRGSDALNKAGEILMYDPTTNLRTLEIDGDWSNTGKSRIVVDELQITGGADFAEYFNMVGDIIPEVGTVLSVSSNGSANLEISNKPYDSNVVGVLSGANGINPGIMLKQKDSKITNGDYPVAISGRVYVKAEATKYEIKPGDLLTSSNKAGFAMKATNKKKYAGAIIGKALTGLNSEEGFVLVLLGVK